MVKGFVHVGHFRGIVTSGCVLLNLKQFSFLPWTKYHELPSGFKDCGWMCLYAYTRYYGRGLSPRVWFYVRRKHKMVRKQNLEAHVEVRNTDTWCNATEDQHTLPCSFTAEMCFHPLAFLQHGHWSHAFMSKAFFSSNKQLVCIFLSVFNPHFLIRHSA